jgi:hypothetical protein
VIAMCNSLIDTETYYNQTIQKVLAKFMIHISILPDNPSSPSLFATALNWFLTLKLNTCVCWVWVALATSIVLGCIYRVYEYSGLSKAIVACAKLLSPTIMAAMVLVVISKEAIQQQARFISISVGLCYCFITIKIIVLSMARMAYANIQLEILPLVLVYAFIAYEYDYADYRRLKPKGLTFLLQTLSAYYLIRLLLWTRVAVQQLCERLDVYLFTIKPKKKD